jgi:hypothetical protein
MKILTRGFDGGRKSTRSSSHSIHSISAGRAGDPIFRFMAFRAARATFEKRERHYGNLSLSRSQQPVRNDERERSESCAAALDLGRRALSAAFICRRNLSREFA